MTVARGVRIVEAQTIADELYSVQEQLRKLQVLESDLAQQLSVLLCELRENNDDKPEIVGKFGQKYKLATKTPSYKFALPDEEYARLEIEADCTPELSKPKMTKTLLDKLLKTGRVPYAVVHEWQEKGWYAIEGQGEFTIKQVTSKAEDIAQATTAPTPFVSQF